VSPTLSKTLGGAKNSCERSNSKSHRVYKLVEKYSRKLLQKMCLIKKNIFWTKTRENFVTQKYSTFGVGEVKEGAAQAIVIQEIVHGLSRHRRRRRQRLLLYHRII
jgi:hypothetical protein